MKNKKQTLALVSIAILLVCSIAFGLIKPYLNKKQPPVKNPNTQQNSNSDSQENNRIPVPDFTFWDMDKNDVEFSEFAGQPIVINFWATWCPFCVEEMSDFDKLIGEYGDRVKFIMLDAYDGKRETEVEVNAYLEEQNFEHLVPYLDGYNEGISGFGVYSFPTTAFIDAQGNLFDAIIGKTTYEQVKAVLDRELGE